MSSSNYPTVNYDVFIPSDWTSTNGGGFTEAQLNTKYLRFPIAQTGQAETLNNITLSGTITTGNSNPMVISSASRNMSITNDITAFTGTDNTCFGDNNLFLLGSGTNNSCFGSSALAGLRTTASNNTSVGKDAGKAITTGNGNTCIGSTAGSTNITTGLNNTFIGYNTSATGDYTKSTAIGSGAVITGNNQIVIGTSTETVYIPNNLSFLSSSTGRIAFQSANIIYSSNTNMILGANAVPSGANNTSLGYNAGKTITSGSGNTCIGSTAGSTNITTGINNTLLGYNTSATGDYSNSTAIGSGAVITASNQVVLGTSSETVIVPNKISCNSLLPITSTSSTVIITNNAIPVTGGFNIGIGWGAVQTLTAGANNVFLGANALQTITANNNNTAIGGSALSTLAGDLTLNINNTAIGNASGTNFFLGSNNTFLGANTTVSSSATTYTKSTAVGHGASISLSNQIVLGTATEEVRIPSGIITTSPATNLYFGSSRTPTLGNLNTAFGVGVFQSGNAGTANNVGVGYGTLQNSQSTSNTAIGYYALPTLIAGSGNNTAIGKEAGGINAGVGLTSGSNNTFIGANATVASGQGAVIYSTAIGSGATITGNNQVVLGTSSETVIVPNRISCSSAVPMVVANSSGNSIITSVIPVLSGTAPNGTNNTAFGNNCLSSITTGYQNTFLGAGACPISATSFSNTGVGASVFTTLATNATPGNNSQNTAIGAGAGNLFTNGANNTFLGYFTGIDNSANTYNQSTAIGYNATITASNQVVLGTSTERVIMPNNATMNGSLTLNSRTIIGLATPITASITLTFPLSEIYYITPSTVINTPIVITLPTPVAGTNNGAKVCFRVVNINATTGSGVSLATTGAVANIYNSTTTATGIATHSIYTTNTTIILSHTFYCLPTTLNANTIGWFQQGSV